jgi:hypothetical protein
MRKPNRSSSATTPENTRVGGPRRPVRKVVFQNTIDIEYKLPEHRPFFGRHQKTINGSKHDHVGYQAVLLLDQSGLDKLSFLSPTPFRLSIFI